MKNNNNNNAGPDFGSGVADPFASLAGAAMAAKPEGALMTRKYGNYRLRLRSMCLTTTDAGVSHLHIKVKVLASEPLHPWQLGSITDASTVVYAELSAGELGYFSASSKRNPQAYRNLSNLLLSGVAGHNLGGEELVEFARQHVDTPDRPAPRREDFIGREFEVSITPRRSPSGFLGSHYRFDSVPLVSHTGGGSDGES
jgi:hypothetical protein